MRIIIEKLKFSSFLKLHKLIIIFLKSFQKYIKVLIAVAKWRIKVKNKPSLDSKVKFKIFLKISICPLDDTGKNSVKPWTIPRIKDLNISNLIWFG